MPKTEFLQIRLSPEDRERVMRAASANHLDLSTWARQAILRAVESGDAPDRREGTNSKVNLAPATRAKSKR